LEAWLRLAERIISVTRREQKERPSEIVIMEQYLNYYEQSTNTQRNQMSIPQQLSQDMNPD
jgi:hypothetical protein